MPDIFGTSGNDTLVGTSTADTIQGMGGNDVFIGGDGDDVMVGGEGQDTFTGGSGNDFMDGRYGNNDVAIYAGNRSEYELSYVTINGLIHVRVVGLGARADEGTDTLLRVENFQFADMMVSMGIYPNNRPILGQPAMADQTILDSQPYSYQIPATSFIDLDVNEFLTFWAVLADGSPLPAWLSFDSATRTFTGTPPISAVGVLNVRVYASDSNLYDPDYEISDDFVLTINQAPGALVSGTGGEDVLSGTFRAETIWGLEGNDVLLGSLGADIMSGGAGTDMVDYSASAAPLVLNFTTYFNSGGDADGDMLVSLEGAIGTAFADDMTGDNGQNTFIGGLGNDILRGLASNDLLAGGAGADILEGGSEWDVLWSDQSTGPIDLNAIPTYWDSFAPDRGTEQDSLDGGASNDVLFAGFGDTVIGGENFDLGDTLYISFLGAGAGIIADFRLASLTIGGATISGIENTGFIEGSNFDDEIIAATGTSFYQGYTRLFGMVGNDQLVANVRTTVMDGGDGHDTLDARNSTYLSLIDGGAGNDRILLNQGGVFDVMGGSGFDTLVLNSNYVKIFGSLSGIESLELSSSWISLSAEQFAGLALDTSFTGSGRVDISMVAGTPFFATQMNVASTVTMFVAGTSGIDVIKGSLDSRMYAFGFEGTDQIRGSNRSDSIDGGAGNDKIMGLGGSDQLSGGAGADQFRFMFATDSSTGDNADYILDFAAGEDKLDFRALDANPLAPGRQALNYIGSAAFSANGTAEVRHGLVGNLTMVEVDLNGDGAVDMEVRLFSMEQDTLQAIDFLL